MNKNSVYKKNINKNKNFISSNFRIKLNLKSNRIKSNKNKMFDFKLIKIVQFNPKIK